MKKSIRFVVIKRIFVLLTGVFLLIGFYLYYIEKMTLEDTADRGRDTTEYMIKEFWYHLDSIQSNLSVKIADDNFRCELTNEKKETRVYAQLACRSELSKMMNAYALADGFFVFSSEYKECVYNFSPRVRYEEMLSLKNDLHKAKSEQLLSAGTGWNSIRLDETNYLICVQRWDDIYVGSLIKADTIETDLIGMADDETKYILTKADGTPLTGISYVSGMELDLAGDLDSSYYMTGNDENVLVTGTESNGFRMMLISENSSILAKVKIMAWIKNIFLITAIGITISILYFLYHDVIFPLENIVKALNEVESNNLKYRLPDHAKMSEIQDIHRAFNAMTAKINTLTIANYEQKVEKQNMQQDFYRKQIRPHFVLNALTTIDNLAIMGKKKELSVFIRSFSDYARKMFHSEYIQMVLLQDELELTESYIKMQEIQFPGNVFYYTQVDAGLSNAMIPTMVLETIVENSVKYGISDARSISIFVKCSYLKQPERLLVHIEDRGNGYPEDFLERVTSGKYEAERAHGFGIDYVMKTLSFLFRGDSSFRVYNSPAGGAVTEIEIPIVRILKKEVGNTKTLNADKM